MTTLQQQIAANSLQRPMPFSSGGGLLPGDKNPKSVTQICDFSLAGANGAGYVFDATALIHQGAIKGIQTIFVDNTQNDAYVTITNPAFGLAIAVPPTYQGFFSVLAAEGSGNLFLIRSATGTGKTVVQFLNVILPPAVWAGTAPPTTSGVIQPVSDAILEGCVFGGRMKTTMQTAPVTEVDHSGSIAVANTAQVLMAANPNRQGWRIQNMDNRGPYTAEGLWICTTGNAVVGGVGSLELSAAPAAGYAGGSIDGKSTNAISVIATTAGHEFYAVEW